MSDDKIDEIRKRHNDDERYWEWRGTTHRSETHGDRAYLLAEIDRLRAKLETWYLLFDGSSVDGRGEGQYIGRTTDKEVAQKHWQKCKNNPYSTGRVDIVTDTKHVHVRFPEDWKDER